MANLNQKVKLNIFLVALYKNIYLQDAVFPVVLIRHSEQLSVLLPGPEPELDLRRESIRLEAERVLDVALRLERARHRLVGTVLASPAGIALTGRAPEWADAGSVLSASVVHHAEGAGFLHGHAAGLRVPVEGKTCLI